MASNTVTVDYWTGAAWAGAYTFTNNPWEDVVSRESTERRTVLVTGQDGVIMPSTKIKSSVRFDWQYLTKTQRDQIITWMTNGYILRVNDLDNSNIYVRITTMKEQRTEAAGEFRYNIQLAMKEVPQPT